MKTTKMVAILVLALGLIFSLAKVSDAAPLGTAFTYQGHLYDNNNVANDEYDFQFKLYDSNIGSVQIGSDVNVPDVGVIDGYFTVELDFGSSVFDGGASWLEIGVRPGTETGAFTTLSPRQVVTPTPYALYALSGPGSSGFWSSNGNHIYNTNTGNVGIGTTGPVEKLDVRAGTSPGAPFAAAGQWTIFGSGGIGQHGILGQTADSVRWGGVFYNSNSNIEVDIAGPTYGLIVKSGNVGIGTSEPDYPLEVHNNGTTGQILRLQSDETLGYIQFREGSTTRAYLGYGDAGNILTNAQTNSFAIDGMSTALHFAVDSDATKGITIDTDGQVGIGTISPKKRLHNTGDYYGRGHFYLYAYEGDGSYGTAYLQARDDSGDSSIALQLRTQLVGDAVDTMYLAPHGNVGIGTTDPAAKLDVIGDLRVTGAYKGNIGPNNGAPFPRPAYDSGWTSISQNQTITFIHGIGGSSDNYVVDLLFKSPQGIIHNEAYGGDLTGGTFIGAWWDTLTNNYIKVRRSGDDALVGQVRVRIWVYN